jgi:hypothetical protein
VEQEELTLQETFIPARYIFNKCFNIYYGILPQCVDDVSVATITVNCNRMQEQMEV